MFFGFMALPTNDLVASNAGGLEIHGRGGGKTGEEKKKKIVGKKEEDIRQKFSTHTKELHDTSVLEKECEVETSSNLDLVLPEIH